MIITSEHVGTCVAWDSRDSACIVRVTSVNRAGYNPSISYESWDGHGEILIESMWLSLNDLTARWRPATEAETASFNALYTPAPVNYL